MESRGFLLEKRYAMVIDRLFIKSLDRRKVWIHKKVWIHIKRIDPRIVFNCKILFNSKKIFRLMAGGRPH